MRVFISSYSLIALSSCGSAPPLSSSSPSSLSWLRYFCSLSDPLCRSCSHSHSRSMRVYYIFFHHLFFIRFYSSLTLLPIHFLLKFLFLPLSLCLKSNNNAEEWVGKRVNDVDERKTCWNYTASGEHMKKRNRLRDAPHVYMYMREYVNVNTRRCMSVSE